MDLVGQCSPVLTTEEWERVCAKHSIPMAPVLELDRAGEDPYVRDGHLLDVVEHPSEGRHPFGRHSGALLRHPGLRPPARPAARPAHGRGHR